VKPISCGPVPDRGRSARLLARSAAASPGLAGVCTGWAHLRIRPLRPVQR